MTSFSLVLLSLFRIAHYKIEPDRALSFPNQQLHAMSRKLFRLKSEQLPPQRVGYMNGFIAFVLFINVAAAAVVTLVLATPFGRQLLFTDTESPTRSSATEGTVAIGAIAPVEGDLVGREGLTLLWHSMSAETSYQITLTNPQGDVVWTARTPDTTAAVPPTVELIADASYYWYVDALLKDGRPATTGIQRFVVGQQ